MNGNRDRPVGQPIEFRRLSQKEHEATLDASTIHAIFVEVEGAYGLMLNGELLTREQKAVLIRAARALPTRD